MTVEHSNDPRAILAAWRDVRATPDAEDAQRALVVASFTANTLEAPLGLGLATAGTATSATDKPWRVEFADYNQIFQACLQPTAHGADRAAEIVVLWRIEDVFERDFHAWTRLADGALERLLDGASRLAVAVSNLAEQTDCTVTVSDAPTPIGFGLDHLDPLEMQRLIELQRSVNNAFDAALTERPNIDRFWLAALQTAHGTTRAFDRRSWLMYRQPFSAEFAGLVGSSLADTIHARMRVPPKVLVLDCDDTLWAGIAANDGIGELQASDAFPGIAHREFQMAAARLGRRGVLLAIASKNDPVTVEEAFEQVDGMVLTVDDIAGWKVSWGPKPAALAELAAEFNVGIDSFVFVDDSDYEVGAMRTQLPEVKVLQVPEAIEELPDLLAQSGLFRQLKVTGDDLVRTERMQAETQRATAATAMSHDEFLADLGLQVDLRRLNSASHPDVGRVVQLINKTNQFNLTTIRRDRAQVEALLGRADVFAASISVDDRFGSYGLVGVIIAEQDSPGWRLDSVLMSCRVLGRGVETAMLAGAIKAMRSVKPGPVLGLWIPTLKNGLVADLFTEHGFSADGGGDEAGWRFVLPAERHVAAPAHVTLNGDLF